MSDDILCCVKCDSVLDRSIVGGVEVDACPRCGGLWLDRGELERIAKLPVGDKLALRRNLTGDVAHPPEPSDTTDSCPRFSGVLAEVHLGKVLVDYCDACHGMFLDKGELDAALTGARGQADVASLLQAAAAALMK